MEDQLQKKIEALNSNLFHTADTQRRQRQFLRFIEYIPYLNLCEDNPTSVNIIAIIQNLTTIFDSGQPIFSK